MRATSAPPIRSSCSPTSPSASRPTCARRSATPPRSSLQRRATPSSPCASRPRSPRRCSSRVSPSSSSASPSTRSSCTPSARKLSARSSTATRTRARSPSSASTRLCSAQPPPSLFSGCTSPTCCASPVPSPRSSWYTPCPPACSGPSSPPRPGRAAAPARRGWRSREGCSAAAASLWRCNSSEPGPPRRRQAGCCTSISLQL
mmetsp:Transcript_38132/g.127623  ORF Transcript_38132/g.127623 Transcript_38132/m.127623 type:complete len:203 (+) Transcript_38132:485-1093(+)